VARQVHDGSPSSPPPRLVIPAYFHPAVHPGDWEWLATHASRVRLVILNTHNGPGSGPEAPFKDMTESLRAAGVPVIGYVDTNYGNRPAGQITTELGRYLDWYDVSGDGNRLLIGDSGKLTVVPADTPAATVDSIIALLWPGQDGDHEAEA
jgi:hypothetical protein